MADIADSNAPWIKNYPSGSKVPVESPGNVEMGGKIDSIKLCVAPLWKTIVRYLSYVCTGFIMYLFNLWIPSLFVALSLSESNLKNATHVIVRGADNNIEIVRLIDEQTSTHRLKVFCYRLFKYYYDEVDQTFKACQFKVENLTFNQIHDKFGKGPDETMVKDNTTFFGKNLTDIPKKSCMTLLFQEVLSPFYIFQIYSFVVWSIDDYFIYAVMICVFSVGSIAVTLYETIQTTNKLRSMSYYEIQVNVFRKVDGQTTKFTVNSSELVPGDLIEIPEGVMMPCDAILLNGSCIMNEAMLTGESIPVIKNSLPYNNVCYNPKEDKQYTLYAGTKCIQARFYQGNAVLGLVTLTGFATVKGELIRTMLFPKPTDFKFYSDSFKFIGILAAMAIAGFLIDLPSWLDPSGDDDENGMIEVIIIKASEIVTVTVPPALPTCMQVGISIALSRLKKKQTYCISPNKINEAGRINVMCFDKTGTLTEEGLDLLGVRPVFFDKNTKKLSFAKLVRDVTTLDAIDESARDLELQNYMAASSDGKGSAALYKKTKLFPAEQMLEILASCHSLTMVKGKMIGDPLDLKMFECTKWTLEENDGEKYDSLVMAVVKPPSFQLESLEGEFDGRKEDPLAGGKKEIGIIRRFEFTSKLQRMSTVVRNLQETGFKVHIKGSPEKIRELCKPETVPNNFHHILEKYTEVMRNEYLNGYRVLACATKTTGLNYMKIMAANREDIEKNFTFIGFLIMENRLKPVTTTIIRELQAAQIRTIMVTGDNALTAISVARQCEIVGPNNRVFLGDISEQKVHGKDVIQWKDFDFSERALNNNLDLDMEAESRILSAHDVGSGVGSRPIRLSETGKSSSPLHDGFEKFKGRMSLNLKENLLAQQEDVQIDIRDRKLSHVTEKKIIASSANIVEMEVPFFNMNDTDNYCMAITGKAFSHILHEVEHNKDPHYQFLFQKMLKKCLIFARMHPDEKAAMIKHMKTISNNIVGMCGDGANDVGALKTANVGISLSEAEASIAAPFTSNLQDISCIPNLLREGRAGLATSYQAFKFMALYSVIQFTSVTILYHDLIDMTNWHYYHIDIMIILPLSGTMALTQAYDKLTIYKPTGRLISVQILSSVLGQALIQILFQLGTYFLLVHQSWYSEHKIIYGCPDNFDTDNACIQNSTMYLVSIFQYCMVGMVFMVGRPFRKPFYTNLWFTGFFILLMIANVIMTYNPFGWFLSGVGAEYDLIPMSWRNVIMISAAINCVVTIFWERVVVKSLSFWWKNYRDNKMLLKEAKEAESHQNAGKKQKLEDDSSYRKPSLQKNNNNTTRNLY